MGQHRVAARRGTALRYVAVVAVLAVAGWLVVTLAGGSDDGGCDDRNPLVVNAAPAVAPAIAELAGRQACGTVEVRAQDSASMLAALSVPGVDPDATVWIPESSTLTRRTGETRADVDGPGTSVAASPVVLAATEAVAASAGWPAERPRWARLVGPEAVDAAVGTTDPTHDPIAAAALLGIEAAIPDAGAAAETLRQLADRQLDSGDALFEHLPKGRRAPELTVFPTTEQRLLQHNSAHPKGTGASTVAGYAPESTPWLDFPYLILPRTGDDERAAAEEFLRVLLDPATADVFGNHGLRTPEGRLGGGWADNRIDVADLRPVPPPEPAAGNTSLRRWATAGSSGHVLTVIDVSGSMSAEVPGTGRTRMQITVEAARRGMALFKPGTEFSLWEFSTKLDGDADHRRVADWKPISRHREEGLDRDLGARLSPPKGATGLYDTTLAAYREAVRTWQPDRTNMVLIMTDGRNEDDDSISREQLLADLAALASPERPLPIVFIGLGTDVDPGELTAIAEATGGQVSLAPAVADIEKVFFGVLGRLDCPAGRC